MKNVNFPIDAKWKPWTYSIPVQTFTGAATPAILSPRVTLDATTWFVCTHATLVGGAIRALIRRNTDSFSNQALHSSMLFGTNLRPYYFPAPIFCGPSAEFGLDMTNAAGAASTVRVQFHGIMVDGTRETVKAGVGPLATANGFAEFYGYGMTRAYTANEREKMTQKLTGDFDFLLWELMAFSTGAFDSQFSTSGDVHFDDNLIPNLGRFGTAEYPGFRQGWFMPGSSTAILDIQDTSGAPNALEIGLMGVRFPKAQ